MSIRRSILAAAEKALYRCADQRTTGRCQPDQYLRDRIRRRSRGRLAPARPQSDRDGGVEAAARDMADRVGHGDDRQPEGERHVQQADPASGNAAASTALPQPPNTSQKVPKYSAPYCFMIRSSLVTPAGQRPGQADAGAAIILHGAAPRLHDHRRRRTPPRSASFQPAALR